MTSAVDASEIGLSIPPDYVPGARGHAVLALGSDEAGSEALAVWRLGAMGRAVGAWVLPLEQVEQDSQDFHRLIDLLRDRCLVDWDTDTPARVVSRLDPHLPAQLSAALKRNVLAISDLLDEVSEHRAVIASAAEDYRKTAKSKVEPLVWPTEVPSLEELKSRTIGAQGAAASPVTATALALTAGLAQVAQLWQDTEQVRYRRKHLRSFGEPRQLPPRWLARLRAAADPEE